MNYFYFELLSMIILFIAAVKEYELLYKCNNKPFSPMDNNANIIEMSVNCIFKNQLKNLQGELQVFMYPITFILVISAHKLYFLLNNIQNQYYLYEFTAVAIAVMVAHVLIPYNFTYINNYRGALLHNFKLADWLDIRYRQVSKKLIDSFSLNIELSEIKYFKVFEKDTYKDFIDLQQKIGLKLDFVYEKPNKEEYYVFIPLLSGENMFFKQKGVWKEVVFSEDLLEVFEIEFGYQQIFYSIFKPVDLNILYMSRFFETIVFFAILHLMLYFGSKEAEIINSLIGN